MDVSPLNPKVDDSELTTDYETKALDDDSTASTASNDYSDDLGIPVNVAK